LLYIPAAISTDPIISGSPPSAKSFSLICFLNRRNFLFYFGVIFRIYSDLCGLAMDADWTDAISRRLTSPMANAKSLQTKHLLMFFYLLRFIPGQSFQIHY
jgi:hypothetical protein